VVRNLDFIGDNPYESVDDRLETIDLLSRLPKPFYFNYFSLTYFPGVDLTERALRDGYITPDQVEDVAEKGYHVWGGALEEKRGTAELHWDVAYTMAARGVPRALVKRLRRLPRYDALIRPLARAMRRVNAIANSKNRIVDRWRERPNLAWMFWANTNRDAAHPSGPNIQPNIGYSPLAAPIGRDPERARPLTPPAPAQASPDARSPAPG
jgi:hypothetical protein